MIWRSNTVLIARNAFSYGGAEKTVFQLAVHLIRNRYKPVVITNVTHLQKLCDEHRIRHHQVRWQRDRIGYRRFFAKYVLGGSRITLQYLWMCVRYRPVSVLLESKDDQMFGTIGAWLTGTPVYWLDHGGISRDWVGHGGYAGFEKLYFFSLSKAVALATVCGKNASLLKELVPRSQHAKIRVCYNGVDTDYYAPRRKVNQAHHIGMISRLVRDKGIFEFLTAVKTIAASHPKVTFSITGEGEDLPACRTIIAKEQLPVTLIPFTHDVRDSLQALDVFVLPTKAESLSLAVLEAMSSARIVAASDVGGMPEIIDDSVDGFLFPPTEEGLTQCLQRILTTKPKDLATIATRAREKALAKFRLQQTNNNLMDLLTESIR